MTDLLTASNATISPCGKYRYWLERKWGPGTPQVFVMLNPSTADASEDDPTIRRCMGFARREGAGGLIVVNLFGLRATDPKELDGARDRVGPDNATNIGLALIGAAATRRPVICAWGANKHAPSQAGILHRRADDIGAELKCLGLTKSGAPKHPLYLSANAPLVAYI
jgi:hypothetical protein